MLNYLFPYFIYNFPTITFAARKYLYPVIKWWNQIKQKEVFVQKKNNPKYTEGKKIKTLLFEHYTQTAFYWYLDILFFFFSPKNKNVRKFYFLSFLCWKSNLIYLFIAEVFLIKKFLLLIRNILMFFFFFVFLNKTFFFLCSSSLLWLLQF